VIAKMRIVRRAMMCAFLLLVLTADLTIFAPAAFAQTSNASQAPPNASLLGVPVNGTAPLRVDF
jgi:hypothetical protein